MDKLLTTEVHIWTARLPFNPSPELEMMLSDVERGRADRFHFLKHRVAYVFAHVVLRDVLSRYLQCSARDIQFCEDLFGKPCLETPHGKPNFNLSHAGQVVIVAVCGGRRIGVDVEEIRPIEDFLSIAELYFTPRECTFIFGQRATDQHRAFFRCWTRKEAYVKAVGKGLSIPLNSFDTLIPAGQFGQRLPSAPEVPDVTNWWLADLDAPKNYLAAVAVETGIDRLVYFKWAIRRQNVTAGDSEQSPCANAAWHIHRTDPTCPQVIPMLRDADATRATRLGEMSGNCRVSSDKE